MNIGLACDHAGFFHKEETKKYLQKVLERQPIYKSMEQI